MYVRVWDFFEKEWKIFLAAQR